MFFFLFFILAWIKNETKMNMDCGGIRHWNLLFLSFNTSYWILLSCKYLYLRYTMRSISLLPSQNNKYCTMLDLFCVNILFSKTENSQVGTFTDEQRFWIIKFILFKLWDLLKKVNLKYQKLFLNNKHPSLENLPRKMCYVHK